MISNVYDNGSSTTLPTDQDADANSPMVAQGKIYTTFSKAGYATFHSTYEGAIAVITHSGMKVAQQHRGQRDFSDNSLCGNF